MNQAPSALRSTFFVSVARLLGATLAVVQGVLSARYFGTSAAKDCYLIAQTIPGLLTTFLAGGIYSTLLVNLAEIGPREGVSGQVRFARRVLLYLTLGLLPFVVAALVAPQQIVPWIAPGFGEGQIRLGASLLRFTALAAVGSLYFTGTRCVFETRFQFIIPCFVNLLIPVTSLGVLVALVKTIGIFTLATGPLLGIALAVALLSGLTTRVLRDPPGFTPASTPAADVAARQRRFWAALLPMSIAASFGQVNLLVDNAFASLLPTGSITVLGFAFVIVSNVQLLTTSSLGEVAFPRITAAAVRGPGELLESLRSNLRYMVLVTAPISVGALTFALPLVRFLFQRGEFTSPAAESVARVLAFYSPGIFLTGYLGIYTYALVARRRFGVVAWISAAAILLNALLDYLLMKPLGLDGIALATTCVTFFQVLALAPFVRREVTVLHQADDIAFAIKVVGSAALMGLLVSLGRASLERYVDTSSEIARFLEVAIGLALGAGSFAGLLHVLQVNEARSLIRRILTAATLLAPRAS